MPIFAHLVWARVYFLPILVKEMSNFGNSCKETNIFFKFWSLECKNLANFASKMPTHGTFDVETSLAKGIIFRKIGLANGAILKLWAAHPCPKFSREPPPPRGKTPPPTHPLHKNTHKYYKRNKSTSTKQNFTDEILYDDVLGDCARFNKL